MSGVQRAKWIEHDGLKIPETMGILATAYVYTQITLQLFYSLKRPSLSTWYKSEFCGMSCVILLNVTVGILGYFAFNRANYRVKDNILQNFDTDNVAIHVCRIGYSISILLTFPMQMLSGRLSATFLYNYCRCADLDHKLSGLEFRCITLVIWLVCVGVGIYAAYFGMECLCWVWKGRDVT